MCDHSRSLPQAAASLSFSNEDSMQFLLCTQPYWTQTLTLGLYRSEATVMYVENLDCAVKFGTFLMTTIIPTTMTVIAITPTSATTPPKKQLFYTHLYQMHIWDHWKEEMWTGHVSRVNPSAVIEKLHVYNNLVFKLYVLVTIARIHPITNWVLEHY